MRTEYNLTANSRKGRPSARAARGKKNQGVEFQVWAQAAGAVVAKMRDVPFGQRENFIIDEAAERKYSAQYLRRALACFRFAESLGEGRPELRTQSLTAVEALKRWAEFDLTGAMEAAERLIKEELSSATILKMEKAARPGGEEREKSAVIAGQFRSLILKNAEEVFPDHRTFKSKINLINPSIELVRHGKGKDRMVAVIAVGPFTSGGPNERQLHDKMKEALACLSIFDEVVIACASGDISKSIISEMNDIGIKAGNLKLWSFQPSDYAPQEIAA